MDNTSKTKRRSLALEERINGVMKDSPDILYKLTRLATPKGQPIEIVTDLPAALAPDIIIGDVQRWREIQKHFDCELRVYAWSYNPVVEKFVLQAVQQMPKVMVTVLPSYLRGDKIYA